MTKRITRYFAAVLAFTSLGFNWTPVSAQTGTSVGDGYAGYHVVPASPPPDELKVLNANVGCVTSAACNDTQLSKIASVIRSGAYDIVFLQEAFWGDDARKIAEGSGLRYWIRGPKGTPVIGSGGTVIISRYPFESYDEAKYSQLSSPDNLTNKGVQEAIINIGRSSEFGREVYWQLAVSNTHLNARNPGILGGYETQQRSNVDEWLGFAKSKDLAGVQWLPKISVGDFNFARKGWAQSPALNNYFEAQARSELSLTSDYLNCLDNPSCFTGGSRDEKLLNALQSESVAKLLSRSGEYLDLHVKNVSYTANPIHPEDHVWTSLLYALRKMPASGMQRISTGINLMGNYPNPASAFTNIPFRLSADAAVSLEIFDITGQKIKSVLDGKWLYAGDHNEKIDLSGLASGPYIYRFMIKPENGKQTVVNAKFMVAR